MTKFCKEDFKYIKIINTYYGYRHVFSVCGESVNYLRNKYDLKYPNVQVSLFADDNALTVGSNTSNLLSMDNVVVTDNAVVNKEDIEELLHILQEKVSKGLYNQK